MLRLKRLTQPISLCGPVKNRQDFWQQASLVLELMQQGVKKFLEFIKKACEYGDLKCGGKWFEIMSENCWMLCGCGNYDRTENTDTNQSVVRLVKSKLDPWIWKDSFLPKRRRFKQSWFCLLWTFCNAFSSFVREYAGTEKRLFCKRGMIPERIVVWHSEGHKTKESCI